MKLAERAYFQEGGNFRDVVCCSFRLTFEEYTTASISASATGGDIANALELLPPIDTVVVMRDGPDDQGAYNWTVTFTSDVNGGDVESLVLCLRSTENTDE